MAPADRKVRKYTRKSDGSVNATVSPVKRKPKIDSDGKVIDDRIRIASDELIMKYRQALDDVMNSPFRAICGDMMKQDTELFFDELADRVAGGRFIKVKLYCRRKRAKIAAFLRGAWLFPRMLIALGEEFKKLKESSND